MADSSTSNGTANGTVRLWTDDGWGVVDLPDLPGGCHVEASVVEDLDAGQTLRTGQVVDVEWTTPGPDEFACRATKVTLREDLQATPGG